MTKNSITAIIVAAGVGSRMGADCPKQYLKIADKTVLEHSLAKVLAHPKISAAIIVVSPADNHIKQLKLTANKPVHFCLGGAQRADSVLAGISFAIQNLNASWVLIHDAARPCIKQADLNNLIDTIHGQNQPQGGILAVRAFDTMKRGKTVIEQTVDRENLWHAQTPQLFPAQELHKHLSAALATNAQITDEASAFEWAGLSPILIEGSASNIKITKPEDLTLANFYLGETA